MENIAKKKPKNVEVNNKSKARFAQTKTTAEAQAIIIRNDNSQRPNSMDSSLPTLSNNDNIFHCSSSITLQEPMGQSFSSQSTVYVLHELHNVSASTLGRCYCFINSLYAGGYCSQCNIPICYSCWPKESFDIYYCTNCYFSNWAVYIRNFTLFYYISITTCIYLFVKFSHGHSILLL